MPIPIGGVAQHYAVDADSYFELHDQDAKCAIATDMLSQAASLVGGKGRLLDIGSGRGELLKIARDDGWSCIGIEPSASFAAAAASYSGADIRCEPIEECNFEAASMDVVILSAVLEHLYKPNETIRAISHVLRPGGVVFLDVPNEQGLYFLVGNAYQRLRGRDWSVNLSPTFAPFHVFGFGGRSLRALLAKHQLFPVNWRYYGGRSALPEQKGTFGLLETLAANAVTEISKLGSLGTYIETWAIKK
jgi:SAM-dependent methyltransferase